MCVCVCVCVRERETRTVKCEVATCEMLSSYQIPLLVNFFLICKNDIEFAHVVHVNVRPYFYQLAYYKLTICYAIKM